ncbi:MAG: hypothetical protein IJT32_07495, partial [Lachnospiraceae bacterium]|nr:hypothetical protein [Lachnospiraceae bacterium]
MTVTKRAMMGGFGMKEWISRINQHRRQSDIRLVLFNIIDIAGLVGGTVSMFISYFAGLPIPQVIAIFLAVLVLAVAFYTANFKNNVNGAAFLIVFVISLLLFPIMFYTNGGLYSGMGFWFLLGIIFNFLLIEGALCFVLLVLQIAVTVFCYIHTYFRPEAVIMVEKTGVYIDVVQSLVVVSLIIGLIVRFQNMVYKEKLRELSEMNEEKERLAKVAADANHAKSSFLAQMSHEIRTPINAVLGMNEMILRKSRDEDILDYARNIDSAGNTLLALINSILDFSKIEDGKMDIIPVEYDTASLINDLYHSIIQRADAKGLELILDVDETLPCALIGDNVRVSQVIMNLLTNAVKYTERGRVVLSIRSQGKEKDEVKILVSVRDTGIGIRDEDLGRLFE